MAAGSRRLVLKFWEQDPATEIGIIPKDPSFVGFKDP